MTAGNRDPAGRCARFAANRRSGRNVREGRALPRTTTFGLRNAVQVSTAISKHGREAPKRTRDWWEPGPVGGAEVSPSRQRARGSP
ncbi:hypothetical protein GCM10027174_24980 [Salinifilum aidingensis]